MVDIAKLVRNCVVGNDGASLEAEFDKLVTKSAALEAEGDRLILLHDAAKGEYPAYSEKYLIRRELKRGQVTPEESIEELYEQTPSIRDSSDILFTMSKDRVVAIMLKSKLTDLEHSVATRTVYGLGFTDIAKRIRRSTQTVQAAWIKAAAKIAPLLSRDPMWGLIDVMREAFGYEALMLAGWEC